MNVRLMGLFAFVVSLYVGYMEIVTPIMEAYRGAESVGYKVAYAMGAPAILLLGIVALIFGAKMDEIFRDPVTRKATPAGIILLVLMFLAGLAGWQIVEFVLRSQGYQ